MPPQRLPLIHISSSRPSPRARQKDGVAGPLCQLASIDPAECGPMSTQSHRTASYTCQVPEVCLVYAVIVVMVMACMIVSKSLVIIVMRYSITTVVITGGTETGLHPGRSWSPTDATPYIHPPVVLTVTLGLSQHLRTRQVGRYFHW